MDKYDGRAGASMYIIVVVRDVRWWQTGAVGLERGNDCMQWCQTLGPERLALRPVGSLQVRELLLGKRFVVCRQRLQTSPLTVVQMPNEALSGEELNSTNFTKARMRVQPGRPVDTVNTPPMVCPSS